MGPNKGRLALLPEDKLIKMLKHNDGVQQSLRIQATKTAAKARALLSAHRDTGASEIYQEEADVDHWVVLSDERGDWAAAAIEFGHVDATTGERVEGIGVLRRAAGLLE